MQFHTSPFLHTPYWSPVHNKEKINFNALFYFHSEKQLGFDYLSFSEEEISGESSHSSETNTNASSNWAVQALKISVEAM